jgi:hypothetical protein
MPNTKRRQRLRGVCDRATKWLCRGSGDRAYGRTQHVRCRYARHCRSAGVKEHITRKWIASEAGRSRVWPSVFRSFQVVGLRGQLMLNLGEAGQGTGFVFVAAPLAA